MTTFDERFAARVREAFGDYHEPVDEAELARLRAALPSAGAPDRAPDRAPVARVSGRRRFGTLVVALAAVAIAVGVFLDRTGPSPDALVAEGPAAVPAETDAPEDPPRTPSEAPGPLIAAAPDVRSMPPPAATPRPSRSVGSRTVPSRSAAPLSEAREAGDPAPVAARDRRPPAPALAESTPADPAVEAATAAPLDPAGRGAVSADVAALADEVVVTAESVLRGRSLVGAAVAVDEVVVERAPSRGLRVVAGSAAAFADGAIAEGVGLSAGVSAERRVAGPVAISAGALVAYDRYTIEPDIDAAAVFDALADAPERALTVATQTTRTTVAVEVPLDVSLAVVQSRRARVGVSVGLTSAVVLSEEVEDAGRRLAGGFAEDPSRDPGVAPDFSAVGEAYRDSETAGPGRIDLARQLNLGLTLAPGRTGRVSAEAFARLPLRERSRDLGLTVLGLRLRYDL